MGLAQSADLVPISVFSAVSGELLQEVEVNPTWSLEELRLAVRAQLTRPGYTVRLLRDGSIISSVSNLEGLGLADGRARVDAVFVKERVLASVADGRGVKLWSAETGERLVTFQGHMDSVLSVAFSPRADVVLTASADGMAKVWNQESGDCILQVQACGKRVFFAAFSPDGASFITAGEDEFVKIWSSESGECLGSLWGHQSTVWCAVFAPDGQSVVTTSSDHTAKVWRRADSSCILTFREHGERVFSAAFAPEGKLVASASTSVMVWHVDTGEIVVELIGHDSAVWSVAYSADGRFICTGSHDRTLRTWSAADGRCLWCSEKARGQVYGVSFASEGSDIVSGSGDGYLRVWKQGLVDSSDTSCSDLCTWRCELAIWAHDEPVRAVASR
eukprot:TRINITY_DN56458_c0_g1_i1.p1 TRINITY_DN56458_c0_g1~~TRINITY_DN56458_c0_g1_i1.p1  ORF type:complete len:389 (+),score=54.73 TRINITY_DN56458_c0_g1_i1:146-1312(+)